jgi:hypothetical protein
LRNFIKMYPSYYRRQWCSVELSAMAGVYTGSGSDITRAVMSWTREGNQT